MQGEQQVILQPMSVDVRLCGSIPRKEIVGGAPCSLKDCLSTQTPSIFAKTNGCLSTLRKTALDALRGDMKSNQVLGQVVEPPSWACAARGETRLEVRRDFLVEVRRGSFRLSQVVDSPIDSPFLTNSLFANRLEDKQQWT